MYKNTLFFIYLYVLSFNSPFSRPYGYQIPPCVSETPLHLSHLFPAGTGMVIYFYWLLIILYDYFYWFYWFLLIDLCTPANVIIYIDNRVGEFKHKSYNNLYNFLSSNRYCFIKLYTRPHTLKVLCLITEHHTSLLWIHSILFPSTIRCIIVGPSNCGKTSVTINMNEHGNGLRFENVYIYSKSPKYIYLEKLLKPLKGIGYLHLMLTKILCIPSR